MLNQVVLVGRLTKDPEVVTTESGKKVSTITLAVQRTFKNSEGLYETDFIKCSLWKNIAENTANYCQKGDLVGIKGRVQTREIETENGKHSEMELVAEKVTFLSSSREKEKSDQVDIYFMKLKAKKKELNNPQD